MEIVERAISYIEFLIEKNSTPSIAIKLHTTLIALKEKREREKGCVGCEYEDVKGLPISCRDCSRRYEDFYCEKVTT